MTIYKNKDITTNIESEKLSINNSNTSFYTEDKGSAALRIFIKHRDGAFNLNNTNLTPKLDLFHNDGSIWCDEPLEVIMSDKGLLQYNIPNNVIAHAGKVKAKLFLRNAEQSVHVANFTFDIKDSGIEGAVEKEISVNIVDNAVRRIVKENAIEILGDDFEQRLNTDVTNHLDSNPDLFKGIKGDKGEPGAKGDKGKDSTQRNFRDLTIIEDIPLQFDGYKDELVKNNTSWYYPQGIAVDDNFYYIAYGTPSNNAKTILVVYDKEFNTVCKYYLGYQYTESMYIEQINQNRYLYCQYDTGYISKFDISNIQPNINTVDIGTPIERYNVGILYRFAKTNDGWVVEQNNQSKGVYSQQDTLVLYDNSLQTRKGVISTFSSTHNELENLSVKRQGLTFIEGSLKYIVGGLYRPNTEEKPHSTQGVLEINSDGSIGADYTYSPNELLGYIENNKTNIDRIEHEGAYTFNNEMYSMIGYRDSAAEDSKNNGLLIVKYGSSDKELTMKEKAVLNIPNAKFNPYKTTINGKLVNEFTGDEITSLKSLIAYMANSHISNIVFYTSRANVTDLDGKTLPTALRVEVENHNNLTFFVTYKGSSINEFYLVTYDKTNLTFTVTKSGKEKRVEGIDLLSIDYPVKMYAFKATNIPSGISGYGFVEVRTDGDVRRMIYNPYNSWDSYINIYNSGAWQGWKKIEATTI